MTALDLFRDLVRHVVRGVEALESIARTLEANEAPSADVRPDPVLDEVLSVSQMAEILGVSVRTVQRRCEAGQLPTMPGTPYRARKGKLLRWIASQEDHNALSAKREMVRRSPVHRLTGTPKTVQKSTRFDGQKPPRSKASGE